LGNRPRGLSRTAGWGSRVWVAQLKSETGRRNRAAATVNAATTATTITATITVVVLATSTAKIAAAMAVTVTTTDVTAGAVTVVAVAATAGNRGRWVCSSGCEIVPCSCVVWGYTEIGLEKDV
jgi:hypothetical protein